MLPASGRSAPAANFHPHIHGLSREGAVIANYAASSRRRAALGITPAPRSSYPQAFTDLDWQREQALRETVDRIAYTMRWAVHITVSDGASREFFFKGPHASVVQRAHQIFGKETRVVSIEPAAPSGAEMFDKRLSLSCTSTGEN